MTGDHYELSFERAAKILAAIADRVESLQAEVAKRGGSKGGWEFAKSTQAADEFIALQMKNFVICEMSCIHAMEEMRCIFELVTGRLQDE